MRFRLTPNTTEFYVLFSQAASNVRAGVLAFKDLVDDFTDIAAKHEKVKSCERKGDEYTRTIMRNLDSTFVTPFDREDIQALAEGLDNVIDDVYHLSEVLVLVPLDGVRPELREQAAIMARMVDTTVEAVDRLHNMSGLRELLDRIDAMETEGDGVFRKALVELFSGKLDALEVLKWKDIISAAEGAIDQMEDVADIIGSILVKHA
jgi:predicted phosphate transport protein (TIGR00153 family)